MANIQVGIIGAGRIAYVHANNIVRNIPFADVKAISDPYLTDKAREWIADLGIQTVSENYQELLKDSEIQAIIICSPTNLHAQMIRESVQAGKHVFCEKPMDLNSDEIKKTLEVIKASGKQVQ